MSEPRNTRSCAEIAKNILDKVLTDLDGKPKYFRDIIEDARDRAMYDQYSRHRRRWIETALMGEGLLDALDTIRKGGTVHDDQKMMLSTYKIVLANIGMFIHKEIRTANKDLNANFPLDAVGDIEGMRVAAYNVEKLMPDFAELCTRNKIHVIELPRNRGY